MKALFDNPNTYWHIIREGGSKSVYNGSDA